MLTTHPPVSHYEGHFAGAGGLRLFCQSWKPPTPIKANIALVHGFGEHSGRYQYLVDALLAQACAVHAYDHRGHGRSPGRRGHIRNWQQYHDDLRLFKEMVCGAEPDIPLFVYGHSLGALVTLEFLISKPAGICGAIVSGAPMEPSGVAKPWLVALAKICAQVLPTLPAPVPIKPADLTHDAEVLKAIASDPLVGFKATVRWGAESLAAIERVKQEADAIEVPLLLLHGADDPLNAAKGVARFTEKLLIADCTLKIYPETLHEPHNDLHRNKVFEDVLQWLEVHFR